MNPVNQPAEVSEGEQNVFSLKNIPLLERD